MIGGSVQISGQELTSSEVRDLCDSLKADSIKLLSLRGCQLDDRDFHKLMKAFGKSHSILQLNLNLGVVSDHKRIAMLADAIYQNRSLETLLLHGTALGDTGLGLLTKSICTHPSLVCLDLGDCAITDAGMRFLTSLLPPDGAKRGLLELTLSANTEITDMGWSHLFCAMSASSQLRTLNVDYNNIGDYVAGLFSVVIAGNRSLQTVDFEGCGITDKGASLILDALENFPNSLRDVVLAGNKINDSLQQSIERCLQEEDGDNLSYLTPRPNTDQQDWIPQSNRPILQERARTSPVSVKGAPVLF